MFHETFRFNTRMQKHMQPQNAMNLCALKDPLRKSWCKTLTLEEIPLSAFNGFSVRWCHIPSSAFKVCLLRVFSLSFSASFQFCCHLLGVCVLMGMWVLCSQQRAGNKSRHCAPYRRAARLWSTGATAAGLCFRFFWTIRFPLSFPGSFSGREGKC